MKRFLLIIDAIFLCLTLRAQSVTYTCRYWFDQNEVQTTTFSDGTWQAELDVGSLADGLHMLHLHVMDTSMKWSAPQSYFFLKPELTGFNTDNWVYHCWFDEDFAHLQTDSLGSGNFLLDVADLEEGLHTLNVFLQGNSLTATQSYMFMRVEMLETDSIDMSNLTYHCWFDQDYEHQQTDSLRDGTIFLDVPNLTNGLHTVNVVLEGGTGTLTATRTYYFYKIPYGGNGFNKWEYCINGLWSERMTTNIYPAIDTLSIVSLLQVPTQPIRSTCFQFHPNGDTPEIFAKNEITLRFWLADSHFLDRSAFYVDEQVHQDIVAQVFERNTTETFAAPIDNQIQWYKLDAVVGDSLAFKANKACTMQLFAPSGEEVYNVSGSESIKLGGLHAWENGTYFLAVHDVMGSGETVSVTYQYVHKYAVLTYDVHLVGNGGCSTITFQGNGFNSLLDAYLVNAQNDTIHNLDIGHKSNTTTTVTFDFYQKNLGAYDAVFVFYNETIRVNGALEVEEPLNIVLTSTVSYPSQFLRNTPCTYTYTITNNGNMSAYNVPLFAYIGTLSIDGISHVSFDGLNLPSIISDIDTDSLSASDILELNAWAKEMGDDWCFHKLKTVDENTGDTITVHSNYFFLNLAPYETKTLLLQITASEPIETWFTIPTTIIPLTFPDDTTTNIKSSQHDNYCCVREGVECTLEYLSDFLDRVAVLGLDAAIVVAVLSAITGHLEGLGISADLITSSAAISIIDCYLTAAEAAVKVIGNTICEGEEISNEEILDAITKNKAVFEKGTARCVSSVLDLPIGLVQQYKDIKEAVENGYGLRDQIMVAIFGINGIQSPVTCVYKFLKAIPDCPHGKHDGGPSTPVNSLDPNDIHGYLSESGSHYMRQEIQNIHYEIEFENDTTLATAAAHTIIVRDTLDVTKFDLNSLAAHSVTIGDKRLELNGEKNFARTLDMRPEMYVIAQIEQDYNPATGIIAWTIKSLDPMTMEPTDNPFQGVLPVNYNGNGIGFIDYSVNLKQAFADGTEVSNRAGIVFDQNDVIMTPTWTNIVDAVKPTSQIDEVSFEADTLNFNFVSSDNRSGVWYHTLYYRNDSTEMEWKVKKAKILGNSFILKFDDYQTTEYLVMAVDSAGNHEDKDMVAEYIFVYDGPVPVTQTMSLKSGWNWVSFNVEITLADIQEALVEAMPDRSITIKSQTGKTSYNFNTHRWHGNIASLDVTRMYKIKAASECELILKGKPVNPADHPIIINRGVNWIAFPLNVDMNTVDAFDGFVVNGDKIKSQIGKSQFNNGRWQGQMNKLEPGKGYIYTSSATEDRTFVFPTGAK